jgi:hypothetical protein
MHKELAGFDVYEKFQSSFVKRALVLLEKINMHHRGYITPSLIVIVDVILMGGNGCAIDNYCLLYTRSAPDGI